MFYLEEAWGCGTEEQSFELPYYSNSEAGFTTPKTFLANWVIYCTIEECNPTSVKWQPPWLTSWECCEDTWEESRKSVHMLNGSMEMIQQQLHFKLICKTISIGSHFIAFEGRATQSKVANYMGKWIWASESEIQIHAIPFPTSF